MQVAEARVLGIENAYDTAAKDNKGIDVPVQCRIDYAMLDEADNVTDRCVCAVYHIVTSSLLSGAFLSASSGSHCYLRAKLPLRLLST